MKFQTTAENMPLPLPGAYRITHISSGKIYIGISKNILSRSRQHASARGKTKISNAINKYGPQDFIFEPILYCSKTITDFSFLSEIEAELIALYDSIDLGYNIIAASGRVGPYGPEFSKIIAASHARKTPAERSAIMKKSKQAIPPERRSEIASQNSLSIGRDVLSQRMRDYQASLTPERRKEIASSAGKASAKATTPEQRRAYQAEGVKSRMLNSTKEERSKQFQKSGLSKLSKEQLSLNGSKGASIANAKRSQEERIQLGRKAAKTLHESRSTEERKEFAKIAGKAGGAAHAAKSPEERSIIGKKIATNRIANGNNENFTKNTIWIHNGTIRKRLHKDAEIPIGWIAGYLKRTQ